MRAIVSGFEVQQKEFQWHANLGLRVRQWGLRRHLEVSKDDDTHALGQPDAAESRSLGVRVQWKEVRTWQYPRSKLNML